MKVIFISIDGLTDPLGQSQILPYLAENASKHSIYVLSLEKPKRYKTTKSIINGQLNTIVWYPIMYQSAIPIFSQLFNFIRLFIKLIRLTFQLKPQILHARSYLPCLAALLIQPIFKTKIVFDMRGFWPDERVEGGIWKMKNMVHVFIYQFFKKVEKNLLYRADHIISLTHKAQKIMIEKFSIEAQKISVIPCAADMQFFNPDKFSTADKNILKLALGFEKDDIIICYQGSLGTWYMTNEMIACVKTMMHNIEKLKWLVLTNDMDVLLHHNDFKGEIKNKTKALSIARDEMPKYLSITDLGLFFILPSYSKQASSPTKLAELMAMEIPVISNGGVGDVDAIISEAQAGIILPELNEANYTFASKSINQLLSINKNRIRAYALKHFKHSDAAAVYSTIYQKINI